ncbi:hypothetical protein [Brevundimonas sp.]|nr:hypothetical protein [Brevundimonas sp.]
MNIDIALNFPIYPPDRQLADSVVEILPNAIALELPNALMSIGV